MSESVKMINKVAVQDLNTDITYLQQYVEKLHDPLLVQVFEELGQTIDLLQSGNSDEYYDVNTRMKKYSNVEAFTAPVLLEKLMAGEAETEKETRTPAARMGLVSRFR